MNMIFEKKDFKIKNLRLNEIKKNYLRILDEYKIWNFNKNQLTLNY